MNIAHHPGPELLLSYAAGATREAVSLLIATHLAFCPECRRVVSAAEETGGALLANVEPVSLSSNALSNVMNRLGDEPFIAPSAQAGDIPEPLRSYIGPNLSDLRWRPVAPGIAQIPLLKMGKTRARLLKVAPGTGVGHHSHHGEELTLVLAGGYTDETGHYGAGDVQTADSQTLHLPVSDPGVACINLAVTDAPLRFARKRDALIGWIFGF